MIPLIESERPWAGLPSLSSPVQDVTVIVHSAELYIELTEGGGAAALVMF